MALLLAPGVPEGAETLFGSLGKALRPAEDPPLHSRGRILRGRLAESPDPSEGGARLELMRRGAKKGEQGMKAGFATL